MFHQNFNALLKDDARLEALVKEILQNGFVVVRDFFDTETLAALHAMAADSRYQNKKNDDLRDTMIGRIGFSDEVIAISQKMCDIRSRLTGKPTVTIVREKQAIGMPFKRATDTTNIETAYHYDGAYINLLFALTMPPDTKKGDGNLILFPSIRERYSPLMAKIISRLLKHSKLARRLYGFKEVVYEVDAMHIFFGDISFHGVEPIKKGERAVITINSHW